MENKAKIIGISNEEINFLVPSARNGMHNVVYNRISNSWTCTCEHHNYRIAYCKHMKQAKELFDQLNTMVQDCNNITNPFTEEIVDTATEGAK